MNAFSIAFSRATPTTDERGGAARKRDAADPTLGNWPAREWPTLEDLEEARRRYPEAMFPDDAAFDAAAPGFEEQEEVIAASFIRRMERETPAESGG